VYDSTDGWRIESYGSNKVLSREVGGTLDAEIAEGRDCCDFDRLARRNRAPCASRREDETSGRAARARRALGRMNDLRSGALRLLAENPDGCTAARMVAHGFILEVLIELIVAGLATTQTEQMGRASQPMGRTHFMITEAGRRALQ
jgi:hypothetical protein